MNLKHLLVPESEEVLMKLEDRALGEAQSQPERTSVAQKGTTGVAEINNSSNEL